MMGLVGLAYAVACLGRVLRKFSRACDRAYEEAGLDPYRHDLGDYVAVAKRVREGMDREINAHAGLAVGGAGILLWLSL